MEGPAGTRNARRKEDRAVKAPREATRQAEVLDRQPQWAAPGVATRAAGSPPTRKWFSKLRQKLNKKVFFFKRECDTIEVFLTSNVRKNIKSFNREIFKCLIDECNYCTYAIDLSLVLSKYIPRVPRRLFFTALQWIAIAQGPKIQQKNKL